MRTKWLLIVIGLLVSVIAIAAIACDDDDENGGDGGGAGGEDCYKSSRGYHASTSLPLPSR